MPTKRIIVLVFVSVFIFFLAYAGGTYLKIKKENSHMQNISKLIPNNDSEYFYSNSMNITSPAFKNNEFIPSEYTCQGENTNPPLNILNIPEKTVSLALIVDDPDSSSGAFTHWLLWNISPKTKKISENTPPEGSIEGITDFNEIKYGGPCPGAGVHRYFFKLYALDKKLDLPTGATKEELENAIAGHILEETQIVGLYGKQ